MHKVRDIILKNGEKIIGYEIMLSDKNLIILKANKGYIACGYINKEISEKFGDIAVFVSGVKSIDDVLKTKVKDLTSSAKALGIKENDNISDIINFLI